MSTQRRTIDQLPDAVYELSCKVDRLTALLESNGTQFIPPTLNDKPLSVEDAAEFLGISKQTVYQNIDKIPHKKRFGRLYFLKSELVAYLETGTQKKA